jgi:OOP family OmpA-OmpF porin
MILKDIDKIIPHFLGGDKMKKKLQLIILLLIVSLPSLNIAQLAKDAWAFGFGFQYPRFLSVNTTISNTNYGGYLSFQRNFSEHLALRLKGAYSHMESEWINPNNIPTATITNAITGSLDFMFYMVPCEPVSPYLFAGGGVLYRMLDGKATATIDDNAITGQFNSGIGVEWDIDSDWRFVTEFGYHLTLNSEIDGALGAGVVNEKDSYMGLSFGALWYFDQGEPSKYCQLYSGLAMDKMPDPVDYGRIEEIVKRYIPREVEKQVVVEKPVAAVEKWVLVGVNFDFNSAKITPDSYPILYDAAKTLLLYPNMKVEIQGYTDNIGSESYNNKLSQLRADAVKKYLVSKGISASRLTATGFGESNPLADNKTAEGRAMNRRIEFKVR